MVRRKGLGKGMGKGYRNILNPVDPLVHSMSSKGIKQKIQIPPIPVKNKRPSPAEIERNLSMFTGTEAYHKLTFMPLLATDGVKYLAETTGSFWLIDAIASYQGSKMRGQPFQVWFLEKDKEGSGATLKGYLDYSAKNPDEFKPIVVQKIPYTDFPLKKIKLFVEGGVLLLPSEH